MGQIDKDTFICLDCEATGLTIETDEIVELAIVKFNFSEILETYETLVNPNMAIPAESMAVHNISDDMVAGKPSIQEVLPKAFDLIGNHIIVGHNIGYDISMLIEAAKRHNIPCAIDPNRKIDTLRLARLYAESPSNKLETLRKHFNIPEEGAHRAMNDVIVNIKVFKHLSKPFRTTEELTERLKSPIAMKRMPLGKHKGRLLKEVPIDYLNWAAHQKFDGDLLFSINQERRRRKRSKPFSESCNPFYDL